MPRSRFLLSSALCLSQTLSAFACVNLVNTALALHSSPSLYFSVVVYKCNRNRTLFLYVLLFNICACCAFVQQNCNFAVPLLWALCCLSLSLVVDPAASETALVSRRLTTSLQIRIFRVTKVFVESLANVLAVECRCNLTRSTYLWWVWAGSK